MNFEYYYDSIILEWGRKKVLSPESLDYNISKIVLQSLTRDLAYKFKPSIRVNAVAIGWVDTDMNKDLPNDYIEN